MGTVMPGVNAAIDQGYADPDRLAVMGQSYGSYCVLALITQTARFKAAIITAAVLHPDLFADYLKLDRVLREGAGQHEGHDLGAARPVLPQLAALPLRPDRDAAPDRPG